MSAPSPEEPRRAAERRHRVLVAEPDQDEGSMLAELLTGAGFVVDVSRDGSSVLAAVNTRPPDVLLVDVDLPGQSGVEVCRRVRQNAATRLLPPSRCVASARAM